MSEIKKMQVSIHAIDADRDLGTFARGGKQMRVVSGAPKIDAYANGCLRIRAENYEERGTGLRGGDIRAIQRRVVVILEPKDLEQIVKQLVLQAITL